MNERQIIQRVRNNITADVLGVKGAATSANLAIRVAFGDEMRRLSAAAQTRSRQVGAVVQGALEAATSLGVPPPVVSHALGQALVAAKGGAATRWRELVHEVIAQFVQSVETSHWNFEDVRSSMLEGARRESDGMKRGDDLYQTIARELESVTQSGTETKSATNGRHARAQ